jgi:drug/metabolite transporter (DMT)-like permease
LHPSTNRTGGYIALATTSILWGTTWVASKIGVQHIPAFEMAAIRQFLGGAAFVLFFMIAKKLPLPTRQQLGVIVVLSVLMFVLANGLSTWSLQYIPTGLSSLIGALYPLSVVVIEMLFFNNRDVSPLTFAGLLLGIGGTGFVFYENAFAGSQGEGFYFGLLLSVLAMLAWSIGTLIIARNRVQLNPYYATGWQMLISSGILLVVSLIKGDNIALQDISLEGWAALAYLVIAGSLISFAAFVYSMKKLPAALFSLYAYFNPLVAIITAGILLGEKLNIHILWGAAVTLLGVFLVNYSLRRSRAKQLRATA